MKKTALIIAVCLIVLTAASLTLNKERASAASSQKRPSPVVYIPDEVKYSALFHYVVDLQEQADELERAGKDGSSLRMHIQLEAGLDYQTARVLNQVAAACIKEVDQQDRLAMAVIEKFRAQFPGGKVPAGVKLPPPPPELSQMQEERDLIILRGRDEIRVTVGDRGYSQMNDFVEHEIAPNIRPSGTEKR
jgi:hypothetical protein